MAALDLTTAAWGRVPVMQGTTEPLESEALLAHASWVRKLARHLVADVQLAEDLSQDACVVALERPPRAGLDPRRWLATVVRNLARQNARGDGRRRARETGAAADEALPGTNQLVERVAIQRELVGAVLELSEPYRTAVLLRFFEELPQREIARRLGVPVATVNSRLTRGLQRLRERLEHEHREDRRAWLGLLVGFAERPSGVAAGTLGGILVNTKLAVCAIGLAVAGTVAVVLVQGGSSAEPTRPSGAVASAPAAPAQPRAVDEPTFGEPEASPARRELAGGAPSVRPAAEPAAAAPDPAAPRVIRGRVLNAEGEPVPGVKLRAANGSDTLATSGAAGWFEFESTAPSAELVDDEDLWITVRSGLFDPQARFDPVVVIAPRIDVAGRVVGEDGRALANAMIELLLPRGFEARFTDVLEATRTQRWTARSNAEGWFELGSIPLVSDADLGAILEGYEPASVPVPEFSDNDVRFVLSRPSAPLQGVVRGKVVDPAGDPVPEARVALGLTSAVTDDDGGFELSLRRAVTAEEMLAVKAGFLPARKRRPFESDDALAGWPEFVVLELGGAARSIAGVVVDADGNPKSGVQIWLADPTPFGTIGMMPAPLEGLMAGADVPAEAVASAAFLPDEDGDNFWDQWHTTGPATAFWNWVATDGEGRFELQGLEDRAYRLKLMDPDLLQIEESDPIAAGESDAWIELPAPSVYRRVAGRLVTEGGVPVEDARVTLRLPVHSSTARVLGGRVLAGVQRMGDSVTTDANGAFAFEDVPRGETVLSISGETVMPHYFELADASAPSALEVVVDVRCQLQIELDSPKDRADGFAFEDANGDGLDVYSIRGGSITALTSMPLVDGRSAVVSASSSARSLVLYLGAEEVERVAINLVPGEVNTIRP